MCFVLAKVGKKEDFSKRCGTTLQLEGAKVGRKGGKRGVNGAKMCFSAFFILLYIKNVLPLQRKMNEGAEKFPHFNI